MVDREPDDNGVDDPPVAVDDAVTARSGSSVPVQVTANDYDPDGEAIAVSAVGLAGHGTVEIGTASTVVYTPDAGYVGRDHVRLHDRRRQRHRGQSATVVSNCCRSTRRTSRRWAAPITPRPGPGTPVVVEVLLNDVDPERDALRIGSFTPPDGQRATIGEVTETVGPSGLPALRFVPADGFEGTAMFSYRPVDALGGQGDDVEVRVEVASGRAMPTVPRDPSGCRPRPPRTRRTPVPVLVNDVDPDGDDLTLERGEPLPPGLDVARRGRSSVAGHRSRRRRRTPAVPVRGRPTGAVAWRAASVLVDVIDDAGAEPAAGAHRRLRHGGGRFIGRRSTCWRTTSIPTVTRW